MSFIQKENPVKDFYTIKFKGKNLRTGQIIEGVGYCQAWHLEDASQQAMEEKYWGESDIFWGDADMVSDIEPVSIIKE